MDVSETIQLQTNFPYDDDSADSKNSEKRIFPWAIIEKIDKSKTASR